MQETRQIEIRTHEANLADLSNLDHLSELIGVSGNEVEEGKTVEVLGALIRDFDNLMVTLEESDLSKLVPALLVVKGLGALNSNLPQHTTMSKCMHYNAHSNDAAIILE